MNRFHNIVAVGAAMAGASCASGHSTPELTPAALASLNAEMQIVGSDTTWVVRGPGYELVGRSEDDLAQVQPALDRAAEMMERVFPADTLAPIVARLRRIPARGDSVTAPAAVASSLSNTVVDLPVPNPKFAERMAKEWKGSDDATLATTISGRVITPAVRAWLSAHADRVMGTRASSAAASGRVPDERVPDWAVTMLTQLGDSASTARYAAELAAHPDDMIPLVEFLVMRSEFTSELAAGGAGGRFPGSRNGGGIGVGPETGGMPGRSGGRGGMGGVGGMREGRRGPPRRDRGGDRNFALSGRLLYSAESAVLGAFLSREGYDVIGQLVDAQIAARPIDDVFARHGLGGLAQADESFRQWVSDHAAPSR